MKKVNTGSSCYLIQEEQPQSTINCNGVLKVAIFDSFIIGSKDEISFMRTPNKVFVFQEIPKHEYDLSLCGDADQKDILLLSLGLYSCNQLHKAREALIKSGDRILISRFRDVTDFTNVNMAIDHITAFLLKRQPLIKTKKVKGQYPPHCDVVSLFGHLVKAKASVDIEQLNKVYARKLPKQVGSQSIKLRSPWGQIISSGFSKTTGEFSFTIVEEVCLLDAEGVEIKELEGVALNLKQYRTYCVFDGDDYRIPYLLVKVDNSWLDDFEKSTHLNYNYFEEGQHTDHFYFELNIEETLLPTDVKIDTDPEHPRKLLYLTAVGSFLRSVLKGVSLASTDITNFNSSQLKALNENHISSGMVYNPPLLSSGDVQAVSYKEYVFGSKILGLCTDDLPSANSFFQRRFEYMDNEKEKENLNVLMRWDFKPTDIKPKTLTNRHKITKVDDFLFPIYNELIFQDGIGILGEYLPQTLVAKLKNALSNKYALVLKDLCGEIEREIDFLYEKTFIPIILNMGINSNIQEPDASKFLSNFNIDGASFINEDYVYKEKSKTQQRAVNEKISYYP